MVNKMRKTECVENTTEDFDYILSAVSVVKNGRRHYLFLESQTLPQLSSALDENLRSLLEWSEYVRLCKYTSITDKCTNIFVKYEGYC